MPIFLHVVRSVSASAVRRALASCPTKSQVFRSSRTRTTTPSATISSCLAPTPERSTATKLVGVASGSETRLRQYTSRASETPVLREKATSVSPLALSSASASRTSFSFHCRHPPPLVVRVFALGIGKILPDKLPLERASDHVSHRWVTEQLATGERCSDAGERERWLAEH